MRTSIDRVLSAVLTSAAVVMASVLAYRTLPFHPASSVVGGFDSDAPTYHAAWRSLLSVGVEVGDSSSPVKLIEFGDLECPGCKLYQPELRKVLSKFGSRVSLVFVHFPLAVHPRAREAAIAAQCAAWQGRFATFVDLVFLKQDSIGLKRWESFAGEAGVEDSTRFEKCLLSDLASVWVDSARSAGKQLGIPGTPTVIVNGWLYHRPPSAETLSRLVNDLLKGRQPPSTS